MATSSIAYAAPSSTRPRRPDPERVYQTYQHECRSRGAWGAFTRTAAHYHKPDGSPYSDEWARKLVKRYEAAIAERQAQTATAAAPPADEVPAYEPPPGARPAAEPANYNDLLRQLRAARLPTAAVRLPTPTPDPPTLEDDITGGANEREPNCQPVDGVNFQPAERDETQSPDVAKPTGPPILPGRDFFDGGPVPAEPEDDDTSYGPLPPDSPAGPLPSTPPALPPDEEPPRPSGPSPLWVGSAPIIMRQVVRVPAEARRGGLVGWLAEHEAARKQLLAVVVFALLVLLSWVG